MHRHQQLVGLILTLCFSAWCRGAPPEPAETTSGQTDKIASSEHWSFQPVRQVSPPAVFDCDWPRTPVDHFVLSALEARSLRPTAPADKRTLLRRVTFDLIGLPPTPEEIQDFLADDSPTAFATVVDRLLASPAYGERWARHWLDVVRYADARDLIQLPAESDFREAWRYRDWVVNAFNRDLPYDEFITKQVAGDLLQPADPHQIDAEALVATGMLALADFVPGDVDKEQMIADYVNDQVDVLGRSVMGLTLGCARCHDHKYDPVSIEDYYALAGIFFSTRLIPGPVKGNTPLTRAPLLPKAQVDAIEGEVARDKRRIAELSQEIGELELLVPGSRYFPEVAAEGRILPAEIHDRLTAWQSEREAVERKPRVDIPQAVVVQDGGPADTKHAGFHDAHVYLRGNPATPGKTVPRGFPRALAGANQPAIESGSGRRELARWLTRPDHPLTARVMVNRIWQHHFGEGLVRTSTNFGVRGELPTHPELLDYLADRFVASGWSVKSLHRQILLSSAYQQSTQATEAALAADPENRWLGWMNRRRLEAEAVRDTWLAVSGALDRTSGGPGFLDAATPRRTLYLMSVRTGAKAAEFCPLFDGPDGGGVVERRNESIVAPQALFLLNDPLVNKAAAALAERVQRDVPEGSVAQRIAQLYEVALGRPPSPGELDIGLQLIADPSIADAWIRYCLVILCTNELVYVD